MGSYSDSTSDLDEEFPVFDFLQPGRHRLGQNSQHIPDSTSQDATVSSSVKQQTTNGRSTAAHTAVMVISSDSDDDAPYVPLAQRLKQRQESVRSAPPSSTTVTNGKDAETNMPSSHCPPLQNGLSQSERPIGSHQACRTQHNTGSSETSPAKGSKPSKPNKRTAEEIQASREQALKRRQARDTHQQPGDKEALRQERDRQKAERKALAEAAKALRPEECIKHMVVAVDPALLQLEGGGTLLASVQALGCSCAIEKQAIPRSVSWRRRTPSGQPGESVCEPEAHVVMQMTADDIITLIHSSIQEERQGRSDSSPTLTSWVREQQRRHPAKTLSLVVIDMEKYFRSQKSQSQKRLREAVSGEETGGGKVKRRKKNAGAELLPLVTRVEVEEAVVHLQLHTGVSVRFLSTWKDFSDHITMTTKAVAEAPFKRQREQTGFSFHLESEWAGGQRVDRAGKGLLQVWKRQIQQLNRVSPDMASAILAAYPSPLLLNKAYSRCKSEGEKTCLLSDLLIRRGEGVTSTTRRVGPELSKRLYLTMGSMDPHHSLDSTA